MYYKIAFKICRKCVFFVMDAPAAVISESQNISETTAFDGSLTNHLMEKERPAPKVFA